jgi:hypothetical protein
MSAISAVVARFLASRRACRRRRAGSAVVKIVAAPRGDLAEDAGGQGRLRFDDEVHGIVRQVLVISGTLPRRQLRPTLAGDRH